MLITKKELKRFTDSKATEPHNSLGMHPVVKAGKPGLVVRAFLSNAVSCEVVDVENGEDSRYPMKKLTAEGFFEGFIEGRSEVFKYRLRTETGDLEVRQFYDPYSFLPTISESDLYLFNEGNEHRIYEKLGSRPRLIDGVPGVSFTVWAPNAQRVCLFWLAWLAEPW